MTYETAKKMEEKGYDFVCIEQTEYARSVEGTEFRVPTLSELIEACGHYLYQLTKEDDGSWTCASINGYPKSGFGVTNSTTPEEAVGALWLSLNEKEA